MKLKRFILDWIWELPQTLIGELYRLIIKDKIIYTVNMDNGRKVNFLDPKKGGVSFGKQVFLSTKYPYIYVEHELGHSKQSRMLGPLYLLVIGLPSFIHSYLHKYICKDKSYYHFYTESWANKLAGIKMK